MKLHGIIKDYIKVNMTVFVITLSIACIGLAQVQANPEKQAATLNEVGVKYLYETWANALLEKDVKMWQKLTSSYQQRKIRNKLVSKKRNFPADVFLGAPPNLINLQNLKMVSLTQNGVSAKALFFGDLQLLQKVESKSAQPVILVRQSLYSIDFYAESGWWKIAQAGIFDLRHQPELKKQLLQYQFEPIKLPIPQKLPELDLLVDEAEYIGNVWVKAKGVEVELIVNGIRLDSVADAEVVRLILGGLKLGENTIQYRVKAPEDNLSNLVEPMIAAIEVFALSEQRGNKPIKLWSLKTDQKDELPSIDGFYTTVFHLTSQKAATL